MRSFDDTSQIVAVKSGKRAKGVDSASPVVTTTVHNVVLSTHVPKNHVPFHQDTLDKLNALTYVPCTAKPDLLDALAEAGANPVKSCLQVIRVASGYNDSLCKLRRSCLFALDKMCPDYFKAVLAVVDLTTNEFCD